MDEKLTPLMEYREKEDAASSSMLDFSLFKDPIFIMFLISNFLTSLGFNVPYVYVVVSLNASRVTLS